MLLSDLATVCRDAGLRVEEVDGWRSRGHGHFASVETIVCHHTAGPASGNMPSLGVVTHGRAGLEGPLCNLGLGRGGTVYVVAAGVAWHAGVVTDRAFDNWHAIGIEAEATGTSHWPAPQMDAYARLCKALADHYRVPLRRVLGHKEVAKPRGRKIDPNFSMDAFRARVANAELGDDMAFDLMDLMRHDLTKKGDITVASALRDAHQAAARAKRIENAVRALGKALGPTVEQAVNDALADATVDVDVTVKHPKEK